MLASRVAGVPRLLAETAPVFPEAEAWGGKMEGEGLVVHPRKMATICATATMKFTCFHPHSSEEESEGQRGGCQGHAAFNA